jgi:hypothetical protein
MNYIIGQFKRQSGSNTFDASGLSANGAMDRVYECNHIAAVAKSANVIFAAGKAGADSGAGFAVGEAEVLREARA